MDRLVLILEINSDTILENSTLLDHLLNSTVKYFSFASLETWQSIKLMEGEERKGEVNKKKRNGEKEGESKRKCDGKETERREIKEEEGKA